MTTCPTCRGELYADRRSVADMAERGYRGGRVTCGQGCTSIWLFERARAEVPTEREVSPDEAAYSREPHLLPCTVCGQWYRTFSHNAKRCQSCRAAHMRAKHREAQQRYLAAAP